MGTIRTGETDPHGHMAKVVHGKPSILFQWNDNIAFLDEKIDLSMQYRAAIKYMGVFIRDSSDEDDDYCVVPSVPK